MSEAKSLLIAGRRASEILLVMPLIDYLVTRNWKVHIALYEMPESETFLQEHSTHRYPFSVQQISTMSKPIRFLKSLLSSLVYINTSSLDEYYKQRELKRSRKILGKIGTRIIHLSDSIPKPIWNSINRFFFSVLRGLIFQFVRFGQNTLPHQVLFDAVIVVGGFISSSGEDTVLVEARRRKVPSFVYFRSHDTLNSKGSIGIQPSVFLVQNEWHRELLSDRHRCSAKVLITGSVFFNHLANSRKLTDRHLHRFEVDRPKISRLLFLSSSKSNFAGEVDFFRRVLFESQLVSEMELDIYVRPHPSVVELWEKEISQDKMYMFDKSLWKRVETASEESENLFDAFFCVNTSGIMDVLVLHPECFSFILYNTKAQCQAYTSQFRNLLESGVPAFDDIHQATKFYLEFANRNEICSLNRRIIHQLLPNNSMAINSIYETILSTIVSSK